MARKGMGTAPGSRTTRTLSKSQMKNKPPAMIGGSKPGRPVTGDAGVGSASARTASERTAEAAHSDKPPKNEKPPPLPDYMVATFHPGGPVDVHYAGDDKESVQTALDSNITARVVAVKDTGKKFFRRKR